MSISTSFYLSYFPVSTCLSFPISIFSSPLSLFLLSPFLFSLLLFYSIKCSSFNPSVCLTLLSFSFFLLFTYFPFLYHIIFSSLSLSSCNLLFFFSSHIVIYECPSFQPLSTPPLYIFLFSFLTSVLSSRLSLPSSYDLFFFLFSHPYL